MQHIQLINNQNYETFYYFMWVYVIKLFVCVLRQELSRLRMQEQISHSHESYELGCNFYFPFWYVSAINFLTLSHRMIHSFHKVSKLKVLQFNQL